MAEEKKKSEPNEFGGYGSCGNFAKRTKEELSEFGKIGAQKSIEVRRKKKEARQVIETFLSMPLRKGRIADIDSIKSFMDMKGKNVTVTEAIQLQLIQKALKGDLNAMSMILSMTGEKPSDKVDINATVTPVIISGEDDLSE